MRRYIVLRSILQSHDKVSLFNESAEIEEKMAAMSPSEFLGTFNPSLPVDRVPLPSIEIPYTVY